jgi:putative ABC transport system ATP-binding protein
MIPQADPTFTDEPVPQDQPVLRIQHAQHYYGQGEARKQVLFDNTLEIAAGEIVIMTGPSGSGKTTLLTLIGGLRSVQEGNVEVFGRELRGLSQRALMEVRRGIGFIFQAHNLFEALTAYQNVKMALELNPNGQAAMHQRITELLTALGLDQRMHYKPDSLSGGQRQRVAIARALANRPRLILADEPTAALDERSGRDVVNLLKTLAREQRTTSLIVTHDNRILDVADRIVNMVDGRIKKNVLIKEAATVCEFLSSCPAFAALTPQTLTGVAEKMSRVYSPSGAIVLRQGDAGETFYLIRRGTADVVREDGEAGGRIIRIMKPGDFFGEMALLTGQPRSATVIAREPMELYALSKDDFRAALEASSSFREQVYNVYFQRQ